LIPPNTVREPWVDALRALALLGVFIVNGMGYPSAPNYPMPLGAPIPADSLVAIWINGFLTALFQGKAYPLLCFLFGYSLCSIAFQTKANEFLVNLRLKTRYKKLLLVGILHGIFIYYGDVLTSYAVCGLIALRWYSIRPVKLLRIFKKLSNINIFIFLLLAIIGLILWFDKGKVDTSYAKDIVINFITVDTQRVFLGLNFNNYVESNLYGVFLLPLFLWIAVAGILVCRFKLLSSRSYSRRFWTKHLSKWHFIFALLLNLIISFYMAYAQSISSLSKLVALSAISTPINIWLVAATLAMAMRHWHRVQQLPNWVYWFAPAGKHTLAMYLTLSLGLMLSGGAFLNIELSTQVRLVVLVGAWFCAVLLAKYATKRGFRDPIASWISTRS
jgi:uncharacterized protein